ncbi:MAG TPA: alpha/beta fold hydrolase [Sphingomicrobium sp.]|nr:alpha/beta fold hydrolase [Sphingomicrobium sp.]
MYKLLSGAGMAALSCFAAHAQAPASLAADAAAFGARESVDAPDLSADGSSVLYLTPGPGRRTIAVVGNLSSGKFTTMVSTDGAPESLRSCSYASPTRAVCEFGGFVESKSMGELLWFSRLVALDVTGGNPKLLGQAESSYDAWLRQNDGDIIDWLGGTDGSVLIERLYMPEEGKINSLVKRTKSGWGVDKVDVTSLRSSTVEPPRDAAGYTTDGRGNVRLMSIIDSRSSGMLTGGVKYFYRTAGSRDWKPLIDSKDDDFVPLAVDADIDSLYALKKQNGRYALYSIKLDGSMATRLVAESPRVDIDNVVRVGGGQKVIGYTYAEDKRQTVYFDPEFKALSASLAKALPRLPLVKFVDASKDGRKLLVIAASDVDPGRYYLFDRDKKTLSEAMLARPELQGRTLASVKLVTIPAPDGVSIPAYLTVPAGREAKGLPAVLLPHGGPSARDEWGFDWIAQFLAARGYAVLQPQYRGSAGFGDSWLKENGFKSWRTSIGDINATARWLISQGIAEPNRLAIVGASYGGYAALQSAATEPSLYKAVVAIAPVTDLALLKQDWRNFTNADLIAREIGSGPHVAEGSPLRRASAINAPVLLVHGQNDANVRVWHSQKMHDALRGAGKQSELLTFKGIDHYFDDSNARTEMLVRVGALLERTIGR